MRREIPQNWARLMERRGLSSIRQLAVASGVSHPSVARLLHNEGTPKDDSVLAVAKALGVTPAKIYEEARLGSYEDAGIYTPPEESARLGLRERKAVDELIRLLAERALPADDITVESYTETNDVPLPQDAYRLAANQGESQGRQEQIDANRRGEESQDVENEGKP